MIKVIIERRCQPDKAAELESVLVELRTKAVQQRGYVSGETLRSIDNPSHWLVISTWLDIDLWKAWETSPERQEIAHRLEPLLAAPEKASIFSFVWEACWWPPNLQQHKKAVKS
ncbi:MAG: antibiotic biosynthesis monooxygenase [Chloroflexi bacterium]|nr:antibiotic biosynthesis monooxygenase [Chloroflexota bacterium]